MRLIFRPIRRAAEEFAAVTRAPVSRTLETYMEMHSFGFPDRPTTDNLPVSVRVATAAKELHERGRNLSPLLRRLENLGWDVHLEGDLVVVATGLGVEEAWAVLRKEGLSDQALGWVEKGSDLLPSAEPAGGGEPEDPYFR